ncbi:MAG: polyphosphate kinase 1 [Vicinamibacterales bacterium]
MSSPSAAIGFPGRRARRRRGSTSAEAPGAPPTDWSSLDPAELGAPALFINRELSWLEFNRRVLAQAQDGAHPLLERVKFLAISATNLDEFFMVRVATILKKFRAGIDETSFDGLSTEDELAIIRRQALLQMEDQTACWSRDLRPLLAAEGIHFLDPADFTQAIDGWLAEYFTTQIFPVLTPLAFDPGHPFPYISNLSMNLAVRVRHGGRTKFARVKVPGMLPRFITLPDELSPLKGATHVFLEDVIRRNVQQLFPGTQVESAHLFRVIRDTDMVIQEDEADDLLETVDRGLKQLRYGALSLLQVEADMPRRVLNILIENFEVEEDVVARTSDRVGFGDWHAVTKLHRPTLKDPVFIPHTLWAMDDADRVFEQIADQDFLVHHPFESFTSVETFLRAAVTDPNVVAIKLTLYRIGANSPLVDLLIEAAEQGKQVAVLVELKARFDERNNIAWAHRLEDAGIHVVYGFPNLKVHSKICLVVRKETDGIRRYAHVATGNYNRFTSQVYTDIGVFTADERILNDVTEVFNALTGYSSRRSHQALLVAPGGLRQGFRALVEREMAHAAEGRPAGIVIKNNAVADPAMIRALYRASQAGVPIDMIVRGVCCLRPGIPGISDRIRVRSIVGRFLEHSRIYSFENGGEPEVYIGSADLMERNLDRRVEVLCPVFDPELRPTCATSCWRPCGPTRRAPGRSAPTAPTCAKPCPTASNRWTRSCCCSRTTPRRIEAEPGPGRLLPAEDADGQAERSQPPRGQDTDLPRQRRQRQAIVHHASQGIVERGERQRLDERLHRVGEVARREEHPRQDPHREHHQVHQPRHGLDGPGAARHEQAKSAEGERADEREDRQGGQPAAHADVEGHPREAHDDDGFEGEEQQPAQDMGGQILRPGHGRRHQALEQLPGPRLDDRKADAPEARAHDVHAEQARHEPVDVAGPDDLDRAGLRGEDVLPARRLLQGPVHRQAGHLALGAGLVEAVHERRPGIDDNGDAAVPDGAFDRIRVEPANGEAAGRGQLGGGPIPRGGGDDAHRHRLGAARAKGDAQRARHDDGEREDPEDGLRLAEELAEPAERQLDERMRRAAAISHRAGAVR